MTAINASTNGYTDTLTICREHIDDANAAIVAVKNMLNAFCESYVDVTTDVFCRRASVSHNEFVNIFNSTIESLHDASNLLNVANGLTAGACMILESENETKEVK